MQNFFVFGQGLTLVGRLTVCVSNMSTISFFLLSLRKASLSFGLFSVLAISSNAALIWSMDDVFGMVYCVVLVLVQWHQTLLLLECSNQYSSVEFVVELNNPNVTVALASSVLRTAPL